PRQNATLMADPPSMSNPPSRDPTPLGGFSAVGPDGVPIPTGAHKIPLSAAFPLGAHDGGDLGRTPMPMRVDGGATVMASPLPGFEGGFDAARHPTRTPIMMGQQPAPRVTGAPAPAYVSPIAAKPQPKPRKNRSALSSLPAILLLATGISAAVVGGVYLAHDSAKIDDHVDDPPPPTAANVPSEPPPDEPPSSAAPAPNTPPGPAHPWKPSGPPLKTPPPKGSAAPVAPPAPSGGTAPSRVPVIPSVLVIPSAFPPFGFPFGQPPAAPPRSDPQQPDGPPPPQNNRPPRGNRPTSDFAVPRRPVTMGPQAAPNPGLLRSPAPPPPQG